MDELTRDLLGHRYLGRATSRDAVAWATAEVVLGRDTPALVILAGLSEPLNVWEVDRYFDRALDELGWPAPTKSEALWSLARLVASRVLAQPDAPLATLETHVAELNQICAALDYPPELADFVRLDDFAPRWSGMMTPDAWKAAVIASAHALLKAAPKALE